MPLRRVNVLVVSALAGALLSAQPASASGPPCTPGDYHQSVAPDGTTGASFTMTLNGTQLVNVGFYGNGRVIRSFALYVDGVAAPEYRSPTTTSGGIGWDGYLEIPKVANTEHDFIATATDDQGRTFCSDAQRAYFGDRLDQVSLHPQPSIPGGISSMDLDMSWLYQGSRDPSRPKELDPASRPIHLFAKQEGDPDFHEVPIAFGPRRAYDCECTITTPAALSTKPTDWYISIDDSSQYGLGGRSAIVRQAVGSPHLTPTLTVTPSVLKNGQTATVTISGTPGAHINLNSQRYPESAFSATGDSGYIVLDTSGRSLRRIRPDRNLRLQAFDVALPDRGSSIANVRVQANIEMNIRGGYARRYNFFGAVNPKVPGVVAYLYQNGVKIGGTTLSGDYGTGYYTLNRTLKPGTWTMQVRLASSGYNAASASLPQRLVVK